MIVSSIPLIIGWVLLLLPVPLGMGDTSSIAMILAGRFLTGKAKFSYRTKICTVMTFSQGWQQVLTHLLQQYTSLSVSRCICEGLSECL